VRAPRVRNLVRAETNVRMGDIGLEFAPAALADAIEENAVAFNLLPAYMPCAELHDEPDLLWFTTGLPYPVFNGVLRARFPPGAIDVRIEGVLARFRSSELPLTWHVGPSTRPLDLGQRLTAYGLACSARLPGMAICPAVAQATAPAPPGLAITPVQDARELQDWLRPVAEGFGFAPNMASATYGLYAGLGFGPRRPLQHFAGRLRGEVVSSGSLYVTGDVAGLYCIATSPPYRRQGIGTAMTLALLRAAQARGCRLAVLYATALGASLYRRIGFETYCHQTFYTWPSTEVGWFDEGCGE